MTEKVWQGPDGEVGRQIAELNERCLSAYRVNPALVEEHANAERIQTEGGYGRRQVWELIQNGADEMLDQPGEVHVVLTDTHLYCANQGRPVSAEGVGAILSAYRSSKRGPEIGRFGLGFKSVLGVSRSPDFFSTAGSFGFDPEFADEQIRAVLGDVPEVPTLRLASPLDAPAAAREDATLAELINWATTVVRLPLMEGRGAWLHTDLAEFPAEFLVFSPHISRLVLDDRTRGQRREIHLEAGEGKFEHRLIEGGEEDLWKVFASDFRPSKQASDDGGAMAKREVIRFQWAVPVRARLRTGNLWAYFPTLEDTTLSGVINAPWKLNDDRTRVIEGAFNREILKNVADLVLAHLDVLTAEDDPANVLDILPARGREIRNWADGYLTERINEDAALHASIPDQTGTLELPASLTLHPTGIPTRSLRLWSEVPTRPVDWAHWSIDANQTRRSRAERFLEAAPGGHQASFEEWLEALVPRFDSQAAGWACIVAANAVRHAPELLGKAQSARIVFDATGTRATPSDVLLPGEHEITAPGIRLVHPALADNERARAALAILGVEQVDPELELNALVAGRKPWKTIQDWDLLWRLAGRASPQAAYAILLDGGFDETSLRVRVASGKDVRLVGTLLPGDVARPETAPDVVVDVDHHRSELDLLRLFGAVAAPAPGGARPKEPAMVQLRQAAIDEFLKSLGAARPDESLIDVEWGTVAGPLTPLVQLTGEAQARYTRALLESQESFVRCTVRHRSSRYDPITVEHPVISMVRRHGLASTTSGLVGPEGWVGPALAEWAELLPVASIPRTAGDALDLPESLDELSEEQWEEAFAKVIDRGDASLAARFYAAAAAAGAEPPDTVLAWVGDHHSAVDIGDLRVTAAPRTVSVLRKGGCPVLEVSADRLKDLLERWSLRLGEDDIASEVVAIETAPRAPLIDAFPMLRLRLDESQRALEVAWCSELRIETYAAGGRETETSLLQVDDGVVYVDERLSESAFLSRLSERLGLDLDPAQIERIVENRLSEKIRRLEKKVRSLPTDAEKLAAVVSADALEATIPNSLLRVVRALQGDLDHVGVARLAFAVHGVQTLKTFRDYFEDAGLQPPSTWAGGRQTVEWVTRLGFGREQAGFEGGRRARTLEVDGPPRLKDLHTYQDRVVAEIHALLRMNPATESPRGMISLPTGAGKTRVAIQALVEAIDAGTIGSPVLWVAQRDELCEQAVQAWSEVWRDRGPNGRLTISRLWSINEAEHEPEGMQVVVATIDKLDSRVRESSSYDWLSQASCIVIDEAHGATTPKYTRLLEWQGMDRGKERAPLLGLTATPYRGVGEVETRRLATRFGSRRLDEEAFDGEEPYAYLQRIEVLSRVEHRTLPGVDIELNADEVAELKRTRLLPSTAGDKLARDVERNRVLLESISEHPDDWTTLAFCASVEHAQVMAGLLTESGIPAAAVSASTPPAARRHYVEAFRAGAIRVLTNYGVFEAGFDAPMVRAVYVARPTYSPNVYQQMIGRGLRGPLNGGSPECLIVNVEDNVLNWGEQLAFHGFEHLWQPVAS